MRVVISRRCHNRPTYLGGGRFSPPLPDMQRHQLFFFGQPGTRRAKRRRPRPPQPLPRTRQAKRCRPAPLQPLSARGERSDAARGRLRPPHPRRPRTRRASAASSGARRPHIPPPARRARRRREAPGLPLSDSAGAAAARGNRRRRFPGRRPCAEDKRRGKPGASRLGQRLS